MNGDGDPGAGDIDGVVEAGGVGPGVLPPPDISKPCSPGTRPGMGVAVTGPVDGTGGLNILFKGSRRVFLKLVDNGLAICL